MHSNKTKSKDQRIDVLQKSFPVEVYEHSTAELSFDLNLKEASTEHLFPKDYFAYS